MKKIPYWFCVFVSIYWIGFPGNVSHASQQKPESSVPVILVLGDSLSASFGIEHSSGWVSLLEQKIHDSGFSFRVVNASISGETTQGGLQRLPDLLSKYHPAVVVLELGGNDGLRGLNLAMVQNNLQSMIAKTLSSKANILLVGIRLPPNYGQIYTDQFHQIYIDLAQANKIPLVPFILDSIATNQDLMQPDGIHPTAKAQSIMLENVWVKLKPLLDNFR